MKKCKNPFLLPALIAGLVFILADQLTAETFTILHSFTGSDGAQPRGGLILSGNTLYRTALEIVFVLNTDGTGFTVLHAFTAVNSDVTDPFAGLILSGNTLYGTASF